jgi:hypothetical protein
VGAHDPLSDVAFLEKEINFWFFSIIKKSWEILARKCELENKKIEKMLTEQLTGLGIKEEHITGAMRKINLDTTKPSQWKDEQIFKLTDYVRSISKPIIIAFNKCDKAPESLMAKKDELKNYIVIPTSAESELALSNAAEKGIIDYTPGGNDFTLLKKEEISEKQRNALEYIRTNVLTKYGSTGVQRCIDEAVKMLDLIVVYPVQDEHHLTDKEGRVLPDAHLIPRGSTAKDLAYKVHTELGDHFIRGIDARTHRIIGADHPLKDGDIISIIADI